MRSSGRLTARRFSHAPTWALALILFAPFGLALSASRRSEAATTRNKISPDLAQEIKRSQQWQRTKVIVQFNQNPTNDRDLMPRYLGGKITRKLDNLKIRVLDGVTLNEDIIFLSFNLLLGDCVMLRDGLVGDGIVDGDGIMVGDGVMIGDGVMVGDTNPGSLFGDNTTCMH